MKKTVRRVETPSGEITYNLTYKKVKNYNLRIKPDQSVELSVGYWGSVQQADRFILERHAYINKHIDRFKAMPQGIPALYKDGEQIGYLGRSLGIKLAESGINKVVAVDDDLYIIGRNISDFSNRQKLVERWRKATASEIFAELNRQVAADFVKYGVGQARVVSRKMVSSWGNCTPSKKKITLNLALTALSVELIKYVLIHEYTHFIHPNHSKDFYNLLEHVEPNWKELKKELSIVGTPLLRTKT